MTEQERKDAILNLMRVRVGEKTTVLSAEWERVHSKSFRVTSAKGQWEVLAAHNTIEMAIGYLLEP